jgi:Glycosyl transferase family 2
VSMHFDILFRSCSRVETATGRPRFLGVPKQELVLRCLYSLIQAIRHCQEHYPVYEISLTIMDDHSSIEAVQWIQKLLATAPVKTQFLTLEGTGNGQSLKENYEFARQHCSNLVYFCEDDYLHDPIALTETLQTYDLLAPLLPGGVILHPYDCPDRYYNPYPHGQYPAQIYLGSTRYWRSLLHTTGTFITSNRLLKDYWDYYMVFTHYGVDPSVGEDNSINLVYQTVPCLSPMPTLAVHLQYAHTISPFIDWQAWWEQSKYAS